METVRKSIEVDVPISTAYNQWTQFEEFPKFMEGVTEVRQLDEERLQWRAEIHGNEREWQAQIVEQEPDRRIAWRSTSGKTNSGTVSFERVTPERTRITLAIEYDPKGFTESVGDALGFVERRVEGDLERFKEFIETRGVETGGWRGRIEGGRTST